MSNPVSPSANRKAQAQKVHEQESAALLALMEPLTKYPLPDALDSIVLAAHADPTQPGLGFARYAARVLAAAHASEVRAIATEHPLQAIRLTRTQMFWVRFPASELSEEQRNLVAAIEGALNRLEMVRQAFEASASPAWSEAAFWAADVKALSGIAGGCSFLLVGTETNPLQEWHGASGKRGGQWDVRTRFAIVCERLRLPFRLEYWFSCNPDEGLMHVDFTVPPAAWFPTHTPWNRSVAKTQENSLCGARSGKIRGSKGRSFNTLAPTPPYENAVMPEETWLYDEHAAAQMAAEYTVRLGVMLAAAAFGTSVGITKTRLVAHPRNLDAPAALSIDVDRIPFITSTVRAAEANAPGWVETFLKSSAKAPAQLDDRIEALHVPLQHDMRPVPDELRSSLKAEFAYELDVLSVQEGDDRNVVTQIMEELADAPLLAIAQLEGLVADAEQAHGIAHEQPLLDIAEVEQALEAAHDGGAQSLTAAENADGSPRTSSQPDADGSPRTSLQPDAEAQSPETVQPLYCESPAARYLIDFAESPQPPFVRYPDPAYAARSMLCDLYSETGDDNRSLTQAQRCVQLAPTSITAYLDVTTALFELERWREAQNYLQTALSVAVSQQTTATVYYRLAFALWNQNLKPLALACYSLASDAGFHQPELIAHEMAELLQEMEPTTQVPTPAEARDLLRQAGIDPAPTKRVQNRLAQASVHLADAGLLSAAAYACAALSRLEHTDELFAVMFSLETRK